MTIKRIQARFTSGNACEVTKALVPLAEWQDALKEIAKLGTPVVTAVPLMLVYADKRATLSTEAVPVVVKNLDAEPQLGFLDWIEETGPVNTARSDALEEAAKVCDAASKPEKEGLAQNEEQWAASVLASRIRSLKC